MRYLLDTNICVMYLNGRSISVRDRLHSISIEEMVMCSVVKAELFLSAPVTTCSSLPTAQSRVNLR
jgi:tRNA(fMet)-specific endonuclease VapC